jgi:hypothetical protein
MTQEKIDLDLDSLVDFLTARGTEASLPTIERITRAGAANIARRKTDPAADDALLKTQIITDADWRGILYFRQAGILAAAVKDLKTSFTHPDADMQDCHIRDYRLHPLFEALASTAVLARRCIDDELADQLLNREQKCSGAAHARKGKSDLLQPRNKLILELARETRLMSTVPLDAWQVTCKVLEDRRLTESEEWKAKPLGRGDVKAARGGVYAIVKKYWSQLSPSLPPRRASRRR